MYKLQYASRFEKCLEGIPKKDVVRILEKITSLTKNPRQEGYEALSGQLKGLNRIRSGKYRIIYEIVDRVLVILIVRVAHRKEVYK